MSSLSGAQPASWAATQSPPLNRHYRSSHSPPHERPHRARAAAVPSLCGKRQVAAPDREIIADRDCQGGNPYLARLFTTRAGRAWQEGPAQRLLPSACSRQIHSDLSPHPQWADLRNQPRRRDRPVSSIAIDPKQPEHLLLGAAGGGIWESGTPGRPGNLAPIRCLRWRSAPLRSIRNGEDGSTPAAAKEISTPTSAQASTDRPTAAHLGGAGILTFSASASTISSSIRKLQILYAATTTDSTSRPTAAAPGA